MAKLHVVVIGGGFGGLQAVLSLRSAPVDVTLVDRHNHHLFQPLLYQVATGGLSPANISAPLRAVLKRRRNTQVLLGEVHDIDVERREIVLAGGRLAYDVLIVATGSQANYFGQDQWATLAPSLKTNEDALGIRNRILFAFEQAERASGASERTSGASERTSGASERTSGASERTSGASEPRSGTAEDEAWLTFVIVGGGATGVELAGALGELKGQTLRRDFRRIDPTAARVILVEAADRLLPAYRPGLAQKAQCALERLGVTVRAQTLVKDIEAGTVTLRTPDGATETIRAQTVVWTAGVHGTALGRKLAEAIGAEPDRSGRVIVEPDLTVPGHPEILVIGDLAHCAGRNGKPLPALAPVAMQQGRYAARLIRARLRGRTLPPFRYKDRGTMTTVGRGAAVVDLKWTHFNGWFGWLVWLFVHLLYIVQFGNRLLIMIQWGWNYFTRNRAARLITEQFAHVRQWRTPEETWAEEPEPAEAPPPK